MQRSALIALITLAMLILPNSSPVHAQDRPALRDIGLDVPKDSPICFAPATPGVVIVHSSDGTLAYDWRSQTRRLLNPRLFSVCAPDGTLYSAEPNGAAWRFSLSDPAGRLIEHMPDYVTSDGSGRIYQHSADSLLVSDDSGATWGVQSSPYLGRLRTLLISPSDSRKLYGVLETKTEADGYQTVEYTIVASADLGASWEERQHGQIGPCRFAQLSLGFVVGASRPDDYLLSEINCSNHPGSGASRNVQLSADGGRSFIPIGARPGSAALEIVNTPRGLLRYVSDQGITRSTDNGVTWVSLPNQPVVSDSHSYSMPFSAAPNDLQQLFLRDSLGQIQYSPDGGDHWQAIAGTTGFLVPTPHLPPALITRSENRLLVFETAEPRCFAETRQCMAGAIRSYWERHGGLGVFGYPISAERVEQVEDRRIRVQWFERDRIEIQADGSITTGRLGARYLELAGRTWQPGAAGPVAKGCRWFEPTGHQVCGAFLRYWQANGDLERFGYPLTDLIDEQIEGQTYKVQYFERRRMEYHPENAGTRYEVLLGLLGWAIYTP